MRTYAVFINERTAFFLLEQDQLPAWREYRHQKGIEYVRTCIDLTTLSVCPLTVLLQCCTAPATRGGDMVTKDTLISTECPQGICPGASRCGGAHQSGWVACDSTARWAEYSWLRGGHTCRQTGRWVTAWRGCSLVCGVCVCVCVCVCVSSSVPPPPL